MKTIKQIADEIGVTKQAVSKRLSQLPPTEVSTADNGTKLISPHGEVILKDLIKPSTNQLPPTEPPTVVSVDANVIKLLQDNIAVLQEQLAVKDKQLAAAQDALHAEQLLHANTKNMPLLTDGGEPAPAEPPAPPSSRWARLRRAWKGD